MARGKPISIEIRKKIIKMSENGISYAKIARTLFMSKSSIQYVIKSFKENNTVDTRPRKGKQQITSPSDNRILGRTIRENRRATTAYIKDEWEKSTGKSISIDTCRRRLKSLGYGYYKVSKY